MKIRDAEKAEREEWLRQRALEREQAEHVEGEAVEMPKPPPKTFVYTPQAYTAY